MHLYVSKEMIKKSFDCPPFTSIIFEFVSEEVAGDQHAL